MQNCRPHSGGHSRVAIIATFVFVTVIIGLFVILILHKQLTDYRDAQQAAAAARQRREEESREQAERVAEERAAREKEAREQAARDAKAAAPTIAFIVQELTGKGLHIKTLSALHTVDELKKAVAVATGAKVEQLQLVLKQKLLDDGRMTLGDCGVVAGSTVNLLVLKSADVEEAVPFP